MHFCGFSLLTILTGLVVLWFRFFVAWLEAFCGYVALFRVPGMRNSRYGGTQTGFGLCTCMLRPRALYFLDVKDGGHVGGYIWVPSELIISCSWHAPVVRILCLYVSRARRSGLEQTKY